MPFSFAVTSSNMRIGSTVMLILSSVNFKMAVTARLVKNNNFNFNLLLILIKICLFGSQLCPT